MQQVHKYRICHVGIWVRCIVLSVWIEWESGQGANGRKMHVELLISVIETYCRRLYGQDRVVVAKLQQSVEVSQSVDNKGLSFTV